MFKNILQKVLDESIKPISGTDAAFLYAESPKSPMHIASLTIVEGSIDFEEFRNNLASKLHQLGKFRQRLVNVPFNLDFPYWADDPNFDLDLHLQRIKLPGKADWQALRELTSSIFSSPLDLRRPLWSISFIEGLDDVSQVPKGSVAIVAKVHHVMVDGMSGVGLMAVLFSFSPEKGDLKTPPPFRAKPLPNELTLLAKTSVDFFKNPLKLPKVASRTALKILEGQVNKRIHPQNELTRSSFAVPKTIFNGSISAKRTWGTAILSLDRIKALRKIMGVTINDLVLAICSGGIRKYLLEKEKLPSQPLVANVPISVRKKDEEGEINNKISNMMIPIATHIEDPIKRLEAIQERTTRGKIKHKALGAKTLAEMADAVPFGLANLAAGVYSRYNLKEYIRPPFNVTISNVPGPQFPLYLNGNKVSSILGLTPVVDGLGLIIAVFSYNGQMSITTTSDTNTMPDADKFSRYIRESANELEELILAKKEEKEKKKKAAPKSNPFFTKTKKHFKEMPKWAAKLKGNYQIEVTTEGKSIFWQIDLTGEQALIHKDSEKEPTITLTIEDQALYRIHKGDLRWEEAQIQGRIKMDGTEKQKANFMELLKKIVAN